MSLSCSLEKKEKIALIISCILFCCMVVSSIGFFMYADRIRIFSNENKMLMETYIHQGYKLSMGECISPSHLYHFECDKVDVIFEPYTQPNKPAPGVCRQDYETCNYSSDPVFKLKIKTRILNKDYVSSFDFNTLTEAQVYQSLYPINEMVYINPKGEILNDISIKTSELASGLITLCFLVFFISSVIVFVTFLVIRKKRVFSF